MAGNEDDGMSLWELVNGLMMTATDKYYAFEANGNLADLQDACTCGRLLIQTCLENNTIAVTALSNVSTFLETLFEQTGHLEDLNEAIDLIQDALSLTPAEGSDRPKYLNTLGNQLELRYDRLGQINDLEQAITFAREAVELTADDDPDQANHHNNLGLKLGRRYERLGQVEDIKEALSCIRVAVLLTSEDDEYNQGCRLNNLGKQLHLRFKTLGEREDLEEAVNVTRAACTLVPNHKPVKPGMLSNLANMLGTQFGQSGRVSDMDESILVAQQAVNMTPDGHPQQAVRLNNLGSSYASKFKHFGQVDDLHEAISLTRQAINLTAEDSVDLVIWSTHLSDLLGIRYERTHTLEDLEEASEQGRKALLLTPETSVNRADLLGNLGFKLYSRFRHLGKIDDLEESIQLTREGLSLEREGNHNRQAVVLSYLSSELGSRYERLGENEDLEESISLGRQSLSLTADDSPERVSRLRSLGGKLDLRYERFNRLSDLEEAIALARKAFSIIPKDSLDLPGLLESLGTYLEGRYGRSQQLSDLEEAINLVERAVLLTSADDKARSAERLESLALKLAKKYLHLKTLNDLEESISCFRKALSLSSHSPSHRARVMNNLGMQLGNRFSLLEHLKDEDEAIELLDKAILLTPDSSVVKSGYLNNLGDFLKKRYARTQHEEDLEKSISQLQSAWKAQSAIPFHRLRAALTLISLLKTHRRFSNALAVAEEAIELLPSVNSRVLGSADQTNVIQSFAGFASDGCALHWEKHGDEAEDKSAQALSLLEAGRGAVIGLALDDRLNFADLLASHPTPAKRLLELRNQLNEQRSENKSLEGIDRSSNAMSPFLIQKQYDEQIKEIRCLPGQENFLQAPSPEKLKGAATDSTIVCVNSNEVRSDAIIVTSTAIRTLRLPAFDHARVERFLERRLSIFNFQERRQMGKKNVLLKGFLTWLWQVCVKEILDALGYVKRTKEQDSPRIHWIGTGPASALPFHAAGDYSISPPTTTMDYVVSSYIPSIRTLLQKQSRLVESRRSPTQDHKMLVMSMATTPQEVDLPGVSDEVQSAIRANNGKLVLTEKAQADASTALQEMQSHDIFHFAGHGMSHPIDAGENSIIFERFDESLHKMVKDPLPLEKLLSVDIQPATLAYLSACSTAHNQVEALRDEVLHLASGFLVAGFANVVASQWSTDDSVCVRLSKHFYEKLGLDSGKRIKDGDVPRALHAAIGRVRESMMDTPILWAAYIHVGT